MEVGTKWSGIGTEWIFVWWFPTFTRISRRYRPFLANISGENSAKFKAPNQVQNQNAGYGFVST